MALLTNAAPVRSRRRVSAALSVHALEGYRNGQAGERIKSRVVGGRGLTGQPRSLSAIVTRGEI
jgi:hypothetical protein